MTMQDIRGTGTYREAEQIFEIFRRPGSGRISDAAELHVSPCGRRAAFTGTIVEQADGALATRICEVDLASGEVEVLTCGPHSDYAPRYSVDGRFLAYLSDRVERGTHKLYWRDTESGTESCASAPDGGIEYFHWSADSERLLIGVAGHEADVAGWRGARDKREASDLPSWMPTVDMGVAADQWRSAWICDRASGRMSKVPCAGLNLWEAVWAGEDQIAAIVSDGPDEGSWYGARLALIDSHSGKIRTAYEPRHQLGHLTNAPLGDRLALLEAPCSDRDIIAGTLLVFELQSGEVRSLDTMGTDVACIDWRNSDRILVAGHRDFETVLGMVDVTAGAFAETWRSEIHTTGGRYAAVAGIGVDGDCALIGEHDRCAPEIASIRNGHYQPLTSFDMGYSDLAQVIDRIEQIRWTAPDGLEIQGWLLRPKGEGPHPMIVNIHGGPIWSWRPRWLGRGGGYLLMLLRRGFAIFCPNPRGSTGRGTDFADRVLGDLGGGDAQDILSGIDTLISRGIADPARLGVMGGSYGGYMTSWLLTRDDRFAAAVAIAPITNLVTHRLNSNIPHFGSLFVGPCYDDLDSAYFHRSPVLQARSVRTPTLNIRGALDRCTPPEEAAQFHNALLQHGVVSCLVTYPLEGHGVGKFPAIVDFSARIVDWFERYMPSDTESGAGTGSS